MTSYTLFGGTKTLKISEINVELTPEQTVNLGIFNSLETARSFGKFSQIKITLNETQLKSLGISESEMGFELEQEIICPNCSNHIKQNGEWFDYADRRSFLTNDICNNCCNEE